MIGRDWYDSLSSDEKQRVLRLVWPFDSDPPSLSELERMDGKRPSEFWAEARARYRMTREKELAAATKIGLRVSQGGKNGHLMTHGSEPAKKARWQGYQDTLDQEHRKHPGMGFAALLSSAADKHGVNPRTIRRHTENPTKQ